MRVDVHVASWQPIIDYLCKQLVTWLAMGVTWVSHDTLNMMAIKWIEEKQQKIRA